MSKFNGTVQKAYVKGTPNKLIQNTTDISVTINTADIDVSDRESGGWVELIGGQRSWNCKFSGIVNWVKTGTNEGVAEIVQHTIDRVTVALEFSTLATGDKSYSGDVLFGNVQWSAPHEGKVTWTADGKGSGPIVPATIV